MGVEAGEQCAGTRCSLHLRSRRRSCRCRSTWAHTHLDTDSRPHSPCMEATQHTETDARSASGNNFWAAQQVIAGQQQQQQQRSNCQNWVRWAMDDGRGGPLQAASGKRQWPSSLTWSGPTISRSFARRGLPMPCSPARRTPPSHPDAHKEVSGALQHPLWQEQRGAKAGFDKPKLAGS